MQIYARDFQARLIFAEHAHKHQDYYCLECQQIVRLRRGIHRKAHYFHIQPNRTCRLHAKGMPHLMLQQHLKNILPDGEVELECQFASIGRIADVAWHSMRLVYEIQCSPISAEEIRARNKAYASLGYQVVWIFHDDRYNKYRLSSAEAVLRDQPHYYSDMDANGMGRIYDQFAMVSKGKRIQRLPAVSINLSCPKFIKDKVSISSLPFPQVLYERLKLWPIIFSGDTVDRCLNFHPENLEHQELIAQLRKWGSLDSSLWSRLLNNKRNFIQKWIIFPYLSLMKLILERACR